MFGKYINEFINFLFPHESNNISRSNMSIKNNNVISGGAISEDIILKLSQNLNKFGILKISKIMSGGEIYFSPYGPVDVGPTISPFDQPFSSIVGPFFGSPFGPPFGPILSTPGILSPYDPPFISSNPFGVIRTPSYSSSFNGIKISDTLINIYDKIMNDDRFNNSIGYLQVPSLAIEYTGEIQLIKLYLTRAKELSEGTTGTPITSSTTVTLLKAKAQKILNEKNMLNANRFTRAYVDTLILSIANLQATINGMSRYNTINNYCINAVTQLQTMNGIFTANNIGATPQNFAANAVVATPGSALYNALEPIIRAVVGAVAIAPAPALPALPFMSNPANLGIIAANGQIAGIQAGIDAAFVIVNNNVDGIFNDINAL